MFLVFEGIDGSGTTTQAQKLVDFLTRKNIPVCQTAEPTNGVIGKFIREALAGKTKISARALQTLFVADRVEHFSETISPALAAGKTVISDRSFLSTIAYSALSGDEKMFRAIAEFFPKPDMVIFLRIAPKLALERISARSNTKDIFERKDFLEKIAAAYEEEIVGIPSEKKMIFDSGKMSIDEIAEEVRKRVSG